MENLYQKLQTNPFLISGPCVIESEEMVLDLASELKKITQETGFTYIFKASFDKANRTSIDSFRGVGMEEGLNILQKVKFDLDLPVLTDIHESWQAEPVAKVVDIIQIPAFLCRQTDLLLAAAQTDAIVNIKKAQFLSGRDMIHPVTKIRSREHTKVMLTERGNIFGNNDLVVDFRNILEMKKFDLPVIMDVTHSVQKPGAGNGKSGGNREYAPAMAYAAATMGVRGFFIETHRNPDKALSDGPNMIPLDQIKNVLNQLNQYIHVHEKNNVCHIS